MQTPSWRDRGSPWVGFTFCTVLLIITLPTMVVIGNIGSLVAFVSFLPMCFLFSAYPNASLRKEIEKLQSRLDKLEGG